MVIYFSGTGNSRKVAAMLCGADERMINVAEFKAETLDTDGEERIIWVFPVYAWGVPAIVRSMIGSVRLTSDGVPQFMVCTCGDDIGLTHMQWRRLIRRRGWRGVATFSVQMPNTYVTLPGFDTDRSEVVAEKLSRLPERIEDISRAIRHHARIDDVTPGIVPGIKSRILRPLFNAFLMSPRPFRSTSDCIGCGKCVKACPVGNIILAPDGNPVWGKNCQMCLACYHVCPSHAVAYGWLTKNKGQYSGPEGVNPI